MTTVRVGITLPSFRDDPEIPIAVAVAAEEAGVDGVFAYDHLFRVAADGRMRPALECTTLLGAVAAETSRVALGTLVARATLRPPATLGVALDTVQRVSGGRLLAAVGAGDSESRRENESVRSRFRYPGRAGRRARRDRHHARRSRLSGVGRRERGRRRRGRRPDRRVEPVGCGPLEVRVRRPSGCGAWRAEAGRDPDALTLSWGGLVVLDTTDERADEKARRLGAGDGVLVGGPRRVADGLRAYVDLGAEWVIIGPIDSSDPENATRLGELVLPLRPS